MNKSAIMAGFLIFVCGCLHDVSFVKRETNEAWVVIIRDGGNSSRDVDVFVDSLLVGATKESTVTSIVVPAGIHYVIFDVEGHRNFRPISAPNNGGVFLRQSYINAYVFSYFKTEPLGSNTADSIMKCEPLKKETLAYYNAQKKMDSKEFFDCIGDTAKFKLHGPGNFEIRIRDTVSHQE